MYLAGCQFANFVDGAAKNMVNFQLHQRSSAQGQTFEVNSLDDQKKTMKMSNLAQKYSVHYYLH